MSGVQSFAPILSALQSRPPESSCANVHMTCARDICTELPSDGHTAHAVYAYNWDMSYMMSDLSVRPQSAMLRYAMLRYAIRCRAMPRMYIYGHAIIGRTTFYTTTKRGWCTEAFVPILAHLQSQKFFPGGGGV